MFNPKTRLHHCNCTTLEHMNIHRASIQIIEDQMPISVTLVFLSK